MSVGGMGTLGLRIRRHISAQCAGNYVMRYLKILNRVCGTHKGAKCDLASSHFNLRICVEFVTMPRMTAGVPEDNVYTKVLKSFLSSRVELCPIG